MAAVGQATRGQPRSTLSGHLKQSAERSAEHIRIVHRRVTLLDLRLTRLGRRAVSTLHLARELVLRAYEDRPTDHQSVCIFQDPSNDVQHEKSAFVNTRLMRPRR